MLKSEKLKVYVCMYVCMYNFLNKNIMHRTEEGIFIPSRYYFDFSCYIFLNILYVYIYLFNLCFNLK